MQSETGFPSSHQLKYYVAYKSRLKLAARAVLSADAGLLILSLGLFVTRTGRTGGLILTAYTSYDIFPPSDASIDMTPNLEGQIPQNANFGA